MPSGRPPIKDNFTDLSISRQRRWQLRQAAAGKCIICAKKAIKNNLCKRHLKLNRKYKKRYYHDPVRQATRKKSHAQFLKNNPTYWRDYQRKRRKIALASISISGI